MAKRLRLSSLANRELPRRYYTTIHQCRGRTSIGATCSQNTEFLYIEPAGTAEEERKSSLAAYREWSVEGME